MVTVYFEMNHCTTGLVGHALCWGENKAVGYGIHISAEL